MAASISSYDENWFPDGTGLNDSLYDVLIAFQNNGLEGSHPNNTGGFYGGGSFSGTSYSYVDASLGFAFQATGDLNYYFPPLNGNVGDGPTSHTLWGSIDSITLGGGLNSDGSVADAFITFTFDEAITGDVSEGRTNDVHDVIWGLMNGSVVGADDSIGTGTNGGLVQALIDNGLDVDASIASLVGTASATDADLALAA
ncbi:heme acquisition protein HasA [Halotalea alkalilenta]|uniref:Heme acquisition protein HasAp n=1 Tax=Halotalea alkalilenta TaxID=376489 RepID=A0A172YIJ0_9GAMM|nr:heme acquisition protein HasA [Halotalea alkalilenta]ANF58972.1 heme acquisition protein HasAp [Halotalea alkalilenta]